MLQTAFGEAGGAYQAFRPRYPSALFDAILRQATPPFRCALDLGAGTGLSTQWLCKYFREVIAVEPDRNMLAAGDFPPQVLKIRTTAENASLPSGSCQLVTCGNALCWMDGPKVIPRIYDWLAEHGVFAAYYYDFPRTDCPELNQMLLQEIQDRWERFRHERLRDSQYTLHTVQRSGLFGRVRQMHIPNQVTLTPAELTGFLASTSYVISFLRSVEDPNGYLGDLLQRIRGCSNRDTLQVDFGLELIVGIKPPAHAPYHDERR